MLFFSVKLIEVAVQSRPKALARILFHKDPGTAPFDALVHAEWAAASGSARSGAFCSATAALQDGPTLAEFWGAPQDEEEELMVVARPARKPAAPAITISPNA